MNNPDLEALVAEARQDQRSANYLAGMRTRGLLRTRLTDEEILGTYAQLSRASLTEEQLHQLATYAFAASYAGKLKYEEFHGEFKKLTLFAESRKYNFSRYAGWLLIDKYKMMREGIANLEETTTLLQKTGSALPLLAASVQQFSEWTEDQKRKAEEQRHKKYKAGWRL